MALTNDQLEQRIIELERYVTEILTKLQGVASRNELLRINASKQSTLSDHEDRISSLETRISNLAIGLR